MRLAPDNKYYEDEKIINFQSYKDKKISELKEKRLEALYDFIKQAREFYDKLHEYKRVSCLCAANKYYEKHSHNEEMYSTLLQKISNIKQEERDIPIRQITTAIECMKEHEYHPLTYMQIKELLCDLKIEFNKHEHHQQFLQTIEYLHSKCPGQSFYFGQDRYENI